MRILTSPGFLLAITLGACTPPASELSFSPADSVAIDSLYTTFRLGYQNLDAASVAALYTTDALYGSPGAPGFSVGRDPIAKNFAGFFDSIRADSAHLELRFRFVRRFRSATLASDVGYYSLRWIRGDSSRTPDVGKFVTVSVRDSTGRWRFALDSYSGGTVAAFEAAPPFEP